MAAYEAEFDVTVSDEMLTLEFIAHIENPMLSGIEISLKAKNEGHNMM